VQLEFLCRDRSLKITNFQIVILSITLVMMILTGYSAYYLMNMKDASEHLPRDIMIGAQRRGS